ncbi:MAG: glycine cleavage system aminomethyltransferase GcvT [Mailhella sp.]|nr:glycine cleavage system aminomethyltransferase GcvT [Mailhella sp.]
MDKKTPLYDVHVAEGGKIVPFGGYLLPVQYATGVIKEHMAVRTAAGLFDVSHMGEFVFTGPGALATLNHLLTNDFTVMEEGRVRYSAMCYDNGGTVDDLVVYKFGEEDYLVVVNAANRDKDWAHMSANLLHGTDAKDISDSVAELALQGPKSPAIMQKLLPDSLIPKKYYSAIRHAAIDGMDCMVSRTGYTGELGYEIYTDAKNAEKLWRTLRDAGAEYGLIPCGLGARDTLRLEASMPLYGHELSENITPLECGLQFAVKLDKPEFIGKEALLKQGDPQRVRVGIEMKGRGIAREHQPVFAGDRQIGQTTSGTHAPLLGKAIAMALVDAGHSAPGTPVDVEIRGKRIAAEIVPMPFYKRS